MIRTYDDSTHVAVNNIQKTAPYQIFLQIGDDEALADQDFQKIEIENVTWCDEHVSDVEVKYIRADLAAPQQEHPAVDDLLHNLQVTTDTMNQYKELAAARLVEIETLRADAKRLDYLDIKYQETIERLCGVWYWRNGYGQPRKKAKSVREAIDAARKEGE